MVDQSTALSLSLICLRMVENSPLLTPFEKPKVFVLLTSGRMHTLSTGEKDSSHNTIAGKG